MVKRRKRGRPATGLGKLVGVRLQPPVVRVLDAWGANQTPPVGRPEAIRRMLKIAMGFR